MCRTIFSLPLLLAVAFSVAMILTIAILSAPCQAQSILRPAGLNTGDQYRLAFVTKGSRDATSSNILDYNAFVTNEASRAGSVVENLDAEWFAIGSTATVDARDNTNTNRFNNDPSAPIFLVDGTTQIAASNGDLWDGRLDFFLRINQFVETELGVVGVWTGTTRFGVGEASPSDVLGSTTPTRATTASLGINWIEGGNQLPTSAFRLYAISNVLTVVPEPCSLLMLGIAGLGLLGHRSRRSRQNRVQI